MSAARQRSVARILAVPQRWTAPLAACVLASLLACVAPAARASAQPLVEPDRVQLAAGAAADPAAVHQAIVEAAGARAWKIESDEPGKMSMVAQTGTHMAKVDVIYDASGFQIKYRASADMDYDDAGGHPVIHPRYNRWIVTLSNEIRRSVVFASKPRREGAGAAVVKTQATSDAK